MKDVRTLKICPSCNIKFMSKHVKHVLCSSACRENERLKKMAPMKAVRFWVFVRDNFKCIYCGKSSIDHGALLVIEHIFPRFIGGQNTFYNVVTACHICNREKFGYMLPKNIILKIWKRNKSLGVMSPYKYVDEIIQEFEAIYPTTRIDLRLYFNKGKK